MKFKRTFESYLTTFGLLSLFFVATSVHAWEFNIRHDKLENGIDVLTHVDTEASTVSLQVFVRAGSRNEVLPHQTGLAHIFEHLMFRGTPKYPTFDEPLQHLGAQYNADTSKDRTRYFINVNAEYLEKIIEVEADRFLNLNFSKEVFDAELGPVRQEREKGIDNSPGGFLYENFNDLAFNRHTYKHITIGTKKDIINMTYQSAYDFYRSFYRPEKIFIVLAGHFDRAQALTWLKKHFGGSWERKPIKAYLQAPPKEPKQLKAKREDYVWKDSLTPPMAMVGYHIPAYKLSRDMCALDLISNLLFLESSPLTKKLTQELQIVQSINGGAGSSIDPYLFVISLQMVQGASKEKLNIALTELEKALRKLQQTKVTEKELEKAVNNFLSSYLFHLTTPGRLASIIGMSYLLTEDPQSLNKLEDCFKSVRPEDIQNVAKAYFSKSNQTVVTLMPKADSTKKPSPES